MCSTASPLSDYVYAKDPEAQWNLVGEVPTKLEDATGYLLNIPSQRWLTEAYTTTPVWRHQAVVVVPHNVKSIKDHAFLYITGDINHRPPAPRPPTPHILRAEPTWHHAPCTMPLHPSMACSVPVLTMCWSTVRLTPSTGGNDGAKAPKEDDEDLLVLSTIARLTGKIAVVLYQ
eukprot:gene4300-4585_t